MDKTKKLKALRGFALNKTPHRRVGHEPQAEVQHKLLALLLSYSTSYSTVYVLRDRLKGDSDIIKGESKINARVECSRFRKWESYIGK
jgi:hypothetical protein